MQDIAYFDLKTHEQETLFFFMFNAFLYSRLEPVMDFSYCVA